VIEQGDKYLQDVTKITPDTPVNKQAVIKYPVTDLNNGMTAESWTDEDDVTFTNPHVIETESDSSDDSEDDGE
jgi:hypothetical protein